MRSLRCHQHRELGVRNEGALTTEYASHGVWARTIRYHAGRFCTEAGLAVRMDEDRHYEVFRQDGNITRCETLHRRRWL